MKFSFITLRGAAVTATALIAPASFANLIQNGSFENGNYGGQNWGSMGFDIVYAGDSSTITDWTVYNTNTDVAVLNAGNYAGFIAEDGKISLDLTGSDNFGGPYGGVEQSISTIVGHSYALTFYIGIDNGGNGQFSGPATVSAIVDGHSKDFTNSSHGNSNQWTLETDYFNATSTTTNIQLLGKVASSGNGPYIGLDNVAVNPVPEPVSASALGLGLVCILRRRSRASSR